MIAPSSEKRERKQVERLAPVVQQRKEVVVVKGKGKALEDIENVAFMIQKTSRNEKSLQHLHSVLFGPGKRLEFKKHLLAFSGLVYKEGQEKEEREKISKKLHHHTIPELKVVQMLLIT